MNDPVPPGEQLVTEIYVESMRTSLDFYAALGFKVLRSAEDFSVLEWESARLFLEHRPPPGPRRGPAANVRVMVPDVDTLWERCRRLGVPVLTPIADRSYGLRDFTIADPDGFGVRFGTRI